MKDRDQTNRSVQRGKDLFSQRSSSHKKPEQSAEHEVNSGLIPSLVNTHKEPNLSEDATQYGTPKDRTQTREEVMEELQEVTRQYLNCPDPKEAAARRQRVLYSDANGLMEATASRILMATASQQALSLRDRSSGSNPNTPPPIQEKTFQEILGPDPSLIRSPQGGEDDEVDIGLDPYYSDISPNTKAILQKRQDNAARIRSLIVNTSEVQKVNRGLSMKPQVQPQAVEEKEETLQEFQNKVKRRTGNSSKRRSPRNSPNVLIGASLKKRKLSQLQNSPKRGKNGGEASSKEGRKAGKYQGDTSLMPAQNPPIQLIPAMNRRKADFRVPPPLVP